MTDERLRELLHISNGFNGAFVFDPEHTEDRGIGQTADCCDFDDRLMFVPAGAGVRDDEANCISDNLDPHVAKPIAEMLNAVPDLIAEVARLRDLAAEGRRHVESAMLEKRVAIKAALESGAARDALRLENASLVDAAHRSRCDLLAEQEELRGVDERRTWLEDEYAIANRHISKLAHIVVTARRKLEYLLRDYPDDKETRALCVEIDAMTGAAR